MEIKRGEVYTHRWGGRVLVEKVGRGKREGQVKAWVLGAGKCWMDVDSLENKGWSKTLNAPEEGWKTVFDAPNEPEVEERFGWRVGDVATYSKTDDDPNWNRTLGADWVWRDRQGRQQWAMYSGDYQGPPYRLIERDGKRV